MSGDIVRRARRGEGEALAALLTDAWLDTYAPLIGEAAVRRFASEAAAPALLEAAISDVGGDVLVVAGAGGIEAALFACPAEGRTDVVEMQRLYVAAPCRGRGHGVRLLAALAAVAPWAGGVTLSVAAANAAARRFYAREGFAEAAPGRFMIGGRPVETIGLAGKPATHPLPPAGEVPVRRATAADIRGILALYEADELAFRRDTTAPETLPRYERAFRRIEEDPGERLYVAEITEKAGPRIAGTFQLSLVPALSHGGSLRAYVEAVAVAPEDRAQRIGETMMRHAVREARLAGAKHLSLTSSFRRKDAHRFYTRTGFETAHIAFRKGLWR